MISTRPTKRKQTNAATTLFALVIEHQQKASKRVLLLSLKSMPAKVELASNPELGLLALSVCHFLSKSYIPNAKMHMFA